MKHCKIIILISLTLLLGQFLNAQTTIVKGIVKDAKTKEVLSYADVLFTNSYIGLTTEDDGTFELETNDVSLTSITVAYLGFEDKIIDIQPGKEQYIEVLLGTGETELVEVEIKAKRKVKKDTAAIALFRRVVKAKKSINPSNNDSYYYEEYEKTQFDFFNVKEKLTKRKILKPFDFIFENMDTTQNGEVFLPLLLKEKITDNYYRKKPSKSKTIIKADQFSGVENKQLFGQVDYSFPNIDIYKNTTDLNGKIFTSPFAKSALITYKYFLTDSMYIDEHFCYKLEFTTRRKGDLGYTGHAWIDKESAAIKSLEIYVLDQINVNFLTGMEIKQEFEQIGNNTWFKSSEYMMVMLNITENKKHRAVRVTKNTSFDKFEVNQEYEDVVFEGDALEIAEEAYKRNEEYWTGIRHQALSKTEENIYTNVKKVKETKTYKILAYTGRTFSSGFFNAGPVEFGRFFQTFSWNDIEGNRYRFGMRTNPRQFRDKFLIEGYLAYGDKDKLFKYHLGANVHLKRKNNKWHMLGGHYRYDWSDFNFHNPYMSHDHILGSLLRRTSLDNLFLMREGYLFYEKEWIRGFTNKFSAKHKQIYEWPNSFQFNSDFQDTLVSGQSSFEAMEISINTRYGMKQIFASKNGGFGRQAIDIQAPVLGLNYTAGIKGILGSDYNYHRIDASFSQRLTSQAGRTYYTLIGSKTFGKVPYPLLTLHKGNRNYMFNRHTYSMMDDLEFVNDAYVAIDIRHYFDGFIFNMIPLIKKFKLRSTVFAKGIYGSLSDANRELLSPDLNIKDLNGFYAEAGVGVRNIFKVLDMYFIWRLTQRNDPNVPKFEIKFDISPSF